jgi:uncharacterized protein YwgA
MAVSELDHLDTVLLFSFKRFETIPGKKALQKLVYFLKESGLGVDFEFHWDKFGPYSPELATYVEDLVAEGLMESETKKVFTTTEEDKGVQYNFRLRQRASQLLSSTEISSEEKARIDRVVELLKEIGPQNLELYATVHYVAKFFSTSRERSRFPEGLFDLVNDYKPNRFSRDQVLAAYSNMKRLHWVPAN